MSTYTVARDDIRNVSGNDTAIGIALAFTALVSLVYLAEMELFPDPYRALFDALVVTALLLPLVLAPLSASVVVGDRLDGRLGFVLGLSTTRREYLLGKALSRGTVASVVALPSVAAGFVIALAAFETTPDPLRFLQFAAITALYALAFVGPFVAVSTSVRSRTRATAAALSLYVVLVPFWIDLFPVVTIDTVLATAGDIVRVQITERVEHYVRSLSPTQAYFHLSHVLFDGVTGQYDRLTYTVTGRPYDRWWYNALVLATWSVLPLVASAWRFENAELY